MDRSLAADLVDVMPTPADKLAVFTWVREALIERARHLRAAGRFGEARMAVALAQSANSQAADARLFLQARPS